LHELHRVRLFRACQGVRGASLGGNSEVAEGRGVSGNELGDGRYGRDLDASVDLSEFGNSLNGDCLIRVGREDLTRTVALDDVGEKRSPGGEISGDLAEVVKAGDGSGCALGKSDRGGITPAVRRN
jgi:hypothetical protein